MYKHSTTHRTLSRRLAALLAALALLAAMALPVYAEPQSEDTLQKTLLDVSEDTAIDTIDGTALAEVTKAEKTRTDGENEASATDPAQGETAVDTEDTEDTDGESTAPAETNISDISDGTENVNATQPTDDAENADAIDTQPAETADDEIALYGIGYPFYIYFAVPENFNGGYAVIFKARYGGGETEWTGVEDMELVTDSTYSGRKVYRKQITQDMCKHGGFHTIQFKYYEGNTYKDQYETEYDWKEAENIANKLFDAQEGKWVEYTPFNPNNHQSFAGKTMLFQNKSDHELKNVKAVFYEKTNGELQVVDTIDLDTVTTGKRVSFKIPKEDCSYIRFLVDEKETSLYNFYGQQDEEGNSHFLYDSGTACCYVYKEDDKGSSWTIPQGTIKVYFDATFSSAYTENGDTLSIPTKGSEDVYCCFKNEQTTPSAQKMTPCGDNLYSVDVPEGCSKIMFSGDNRISPVNSGASTDWVPIDWSLDEPCYMADTNDAVVYNNNAPRGGYWKEKTAIRDAEAGKGTTVVDIDNTTPFVRNSATKYVTTTLYDYYTDWELNGNNRDDYKVDNGASHRNWVTFRQFDQALSDYYSNSGVTVLYPMYTGQFQPEAVGDDGKDWGFRFNDIADKLNLYGYSDKNTFMAVNNSTIDVDGKGLKSYEKKYYDDAFQGLAGDELVNGEPVLYNTKLTVPYFNKDFLEGANSKKAVLGKVYENVDFPFTKEDVFGNGINYWHYESNDKSLFLKQKQGMEDQYFLQQPAETVVKDKMVSNNAQNVNSSSTPSNTYGFFPFNEGSSETHANTYNYGFGAKLQFDFTLTDDGQVLGNDGKVPIQFFFSGDDDVWVYIDDKLALDVGGDHGKVSGLLEFGLNDGKLVYTPYVSDVKASNRDRMYKKESNVKSVNYRVADKQYKSIPFNYKGDQKEISTGKHTLKFFYMERGMWESNMAIAFNFPDNNELQVQKIVDDKNVNELFAGCFDDQRLFNFTIRNQATHYGTVDTETDNVSTINLLEPGKSTSDQKDFTTEATTTGSGNIFEKVENPPEELKDGNSTSLLKWYAKFKDLEPEPGSNKETRYGKLKLNKPIDITGMSYLSFDIYVDSDKGDAALSNMYLQLRDSKGNQKGCLGRTFIGGKMLYGQVEMHNMHWITVKLSLDDMQEQESFERNNVTELLFGCNYPRDIYLRNIVFSAKAVPKQITGFTTKQETIADYGSAQKGELMPAVNAQYTSDAEKGTMVVDKNGGFVLKNKETITFRDQFRRGSYLSINEQVDTKLFDTKWTIYEDGEAVISTVDGNKIDLVDNTSKNLTDVEGTAPDDGRIEVKNAEGDSAQIDNYHNAYDGKKPSTKKEDDNTIVFRSYAKPDATDADGQTQLKVEFVNTVRTGSLTIVKQQAQGSDPLEGTYHFKVRFTNVGGHALEDEAIEKEYTATVDEPCVIDKIPVGTRFTIEEVTPTEDGSKLTEVSVTGGGSGTMGLTNHTVRGSIVEGAASDGNQAVATFTNTKQELLDITGTKQWQNADNSLMTEHPSTIYVQLQRRRVSETSESFWTPVTYLNETYTKVEQDHKGMNFSFLGLPAKDYSNPNKPNFEYRVVEGSVDGEGFHAVGDGKTITIDEKVYCVTYNPVTVSKLDDSSNNAKQTVTITNTQQDPKFTLDITKADAEDGTTPLKDVEFTLEKLDENGQADASFGTKTGITDGQGVLKLKGSDGITSDKAFTDLEAGRYRLTETKAAKDYNLLSAPIIITFTKEGQCQIGNDNRMQAKDGTIFTGNAATGYTLALTVLNRKTPALPHTGADAPSLWLLIGLPLAVAGLLILVFRYNKKGGRTR